MTYIATRLDHALARCSTADAVLSLERRIEEAADNRLITGQEYYDLLDCLYAIRLPAEEADTLFCYRHDC